MAKCFTKGCKKGATVRHRETNQEGQSKSYPFCKECSAQQLYDPISNVTVTVIDIASNKVLNVCKPEKRTSA